MAIQIRGALKAELRLRYQHLRADRGARWSTTAGQAFLHELHALAQRHGQRQLAEALQVSPQGVSRMLRRYDPTQLFADLRTQAALVDLAAAHAQVLAWRRLGRQVRRHHESYRRVHRAISELAVIYEVPTIARLSGIRAQELHRFMDTPTEPTFDDIALLVLLEAYEGGRALSGPKCRAFLSQLEETLASHELVDVARVLNVSPRVVRTWMVDKAHGQRAEGPQDPRAGGR